MRRMLPAWPRRAALANAGRLYGKFKCAARRRDPPTNATPEIDYADVVIPGRDADNQWGFEVYCGDRNLNGVVDVNIPTEYSYINESRFVGDINADGFGDIAFVEFANSLCGSTGPNVAILHGGKDSDSFIFDHLCRTAGSPSVSLGLAHAGDLDGDGFAELPVARDYASTENSVYLLSGGASIAPTPAVEMDTRTGAPYPHTDTAGIAMAGAGDFCQSISMRHCRIRRRPQLRPCPLIPYTYSRQRRRRYKHAKAALQFAPRRSESTPRYGCTASSLRPSADFLFKGAARWTTYSLNGGRRQDAVRTTCDVGWAAVR